MQKKIGDIPIYNSGGAGSGWGTGEERAAYSGNITKSAKKNTYSAALPVFDKGERVRHATFGAGTVLNVRSMGGDTLYEVEFDTVGIKKLMASFARLKKE